MLCSILLVPHVTYFWHLLLLTWSEWIWKSMVFVLYLSYKFLLFQIHTKDRKFHNFFPSFTTEPLGQCHGMQAHILLYIPSIRFFKFSDLPCEKGPIRAKIALLTSWTDALWQFWLVWWIFSISWYMYYIYENSFHSLHTKLWWYLVILLKKPLIGNV